MSKKILIIIDSLQTGGAERSIYEIAVKLKSFIPVICTLYSDKNDLKADFTDSNIKVIEFNIKRSSKQWFLEGKRGLENLIDIEKPDIIHANLFKSELVARLSNIPSKIPLIGAFVNDSYSKERYLEQSWIRNLKLNFIKFIDRQTAQKPNYYTSITNTIAKSNAKALNVDKDKITTIYRGRSIENYTINQPKFVHGQLFTFLTVARLLKRKGYIELIDAVERLKDSNYKFICKVAGDGADAVAIKSYAKEKKLDNFFDFLGNQKNVSALLTNAHCFVFPSHYEGQGGALIEAMLSAKPIILSDIPVFKEQIIQDSTGVFFNSKDSKDLSNKMEWVMSNYTQAKLMGLNARNYAESNFDINVIADIYDSYYQNILNNHFKL